MGVESRDSSRSIYVENFPAICGLGHGGKGDKWRRCGWVCTSGEMRLLFFVYDETDLWFGLGNAGVQDEVGRGVSM